LKTIKFVVLFIIAIFISACNIDGTSSHVYQYFNFSNFFIGKDGNVTVGTRYNFVDSNETFFINQNQNTYKWNKTNITYSFNEDNNTYPFSNNNFYTNSSIARRFSIDDRALVCYGKNTETRWDDFVEFECKVKEDGGIITKSLFGDIYNEEYKQVIIKYVKRYATPSPLLYFFDSNNNMHIFYNDTKHAKGKYFNYVMFTEDEPTVPKYEQKIERKK